MASTETKIARCTTCRSEFSESELAGVSACPRCGTKGVPMSIAQDVTVRINWHELRILTIWASNWAARCAESDRPGYDSPAAVGSIIRALEKQKPDESYPPLTLLGEVQKIAEEFGTEATMIEGSKRTVVKPPTKQ